MGRRSCTVPIPAAPAPSGRMDPPRRPGPVKARRRGERTVQHGGMSPEFLEGYTTLLAEVSDTGRLPRRAELDALREVGEPDRKSVV